MIHKLWEEIKRNESVRQNVSALRKELKDREKLQCFNTLVSKETGVLLGLLESEDAKTRKNAALLLGDLGNQEFLTPLYEAYEKEQQLFVKSSYLTAMGNLDYRMYLEAFRERMAKLEQQTLTEENQKHYMEEMRALSALILRMEGTKKHPFTGWNESYDVVLLSNRNFTGFLSEKIKEKVPEAVTKPIGAGIIVRVPHLNWLRDVRIYQDVLFMVKGMTTCPMDAQKIAEMVMKSDLMSLLDRSHGGQAPYYFRLELKSRRPLSEKSAFAKKTAGKIEQLSHRNLINSTDRYEMELRFIENKEGNCNVLLKLFTLKEERFAYRKEVLPTSIKPVNAALTAELAKEYLKEDAQVLDPFCGTGTMLIERHKAVRAKTCYGLDIKEEAVEKARLNTEAAGQVVHYINRDFFTFQHEYLFDEVITDMPFVMGKTTEEEIFSLYQGFFRAVPGHLKRDAKIILYTHNRRFVNHLAPEAGFSVLKEYAISPKEGIYVMILGRKNF